MIILLKMGKIRSMSVECIKEFGKWPLFKRTSYRCETIVDMPYTQIIFTSGKWTPIRRAANDEQKIEEVAEHPAGTDRNRS